MSADEEILDAEVLEDSAELDLIAPPSMALAPIVELRQGILHLDDTRAELAAKGDVDSLAYGAADLAVLRADLGELERATRDDIAKLMLAAHVDPDTGESKKGNPKREVPGLAGVIDVPGGNEWKDWDSERLLRKLIRNVIYDGDELRHFDHPIDVGDAIAAVIIATMPVTPSTAWKVGSKDKVTGEWSGLRGAGINPERYASHTAKPRLAKVPKRVEP